MGEITTTANVVYADVGDPDKGDIRALFGVVDSQVAAVTSLADATALSMAVTGEDRDRRPGEAYRLWTHALDGSPSAAAPIDASLVKVTAAGSVVRIPGTTYLAPRAVTGIEPGRPYRVRAVIRLNTSSGDPFGDTVQVGVRWLDQVKGGITSTIVATLQEFSSTSRYEVAVIVSTTAADDVTFVAPSGAVYGRPFVWTFGSGALLDVEVLEIEDIFDAVAYSPDLSSIENRVAAVESQSAANSGTVSATAAEVAAARGSKTELRNRLADIENSVSTEAEARGTADTSINASLSALGSRATALEAADVDLAAALAAHLADADYPKIQRLTIADDAAASFTPAGTVGRIAVTAAASISGDVIFDTDSPATAILIGGADLEVDTGALTGADGTDAKLTVSAHTDGDLYIENRSGASVDLLVLVTA
jgi:hypothetical protein